MEIIGLILVVVVVGGALYGLFRLISSHQTNFSSRRIFLNSGINPEIICRSASNSCSVKAVWDVESTNQANVQVRLIRPDNSVNELSNSLSGQLELNPNDSGIFRETGVYMFEVSATAGGAAPETKSHAIHFHSEPEFFLDDTWSTGFEGGTLSLEETTATRSLVLSSDPYFREVSEIGNKAPTNMTICGKSIVLRKLSYTSGQIRSDGAGVRKIEILVRRPGGQTIHTQTLALAEEIILSQEVIVAEGIEILTTMRSEVDPPRSINSSSWSIRLTMGCI